MHCPACAEPVAPSDRFCASCGHDLTRRGDERRVVTVLFADLVGFTTLAETRDPEQVKNLVDRCFERLVADIGAFDGRVDKIIGDAIVALFGAPTAHEDDAERAVRAGLQMQRTVYEWADLAGASALQLRIGINTGEVLVGALRAGGDYTAMGDVVNIASRLQTAAAPGRVLVGPATYSSTRNVVRYSSVGPIQAKGRGELVDAWIAEEALLPPGYRPNRVRAPLVGRDPELGLLCHAVDAAVARRRAQLLLVVAEAGMGKTRLAEEVASVAECAHDAIVLEGRCVPYGEANVWWPVAEALRYGCSIGASDPAEVARDRAFQSVANVVGEAAGTAETDRITTGLMYLMGYDGPLRDIDPARAREEASRSLLTFLEAAARRRPVVIVLSDLHWADDQVLDLLDVLLERVSTQPVVVVATARHTLEERWTPKPGRHNVVLLNLDPLDREASGALLAALLESDIEPHVRDLLLDRSGGNPFYLEELVSLVSESPAALALPGGHGSSDLPEHLPDTLRGLVAARLDALTADERRTLGDAAVLGRRGTVASLGIMAREAWGVADIAGVVEGLVAKEILVVDDGKWSFRSDLVREVAYGTLTKADRARRHAGIGKWMEHHEGTNTAVVDRIAHHYGIAAAIVAELGPVEGTPVDIEERGLDWLERAAAQAAEGDLHVVAARLYGQAIELEPAAGPRRQRLLLGRARALAHLRDCALARDDAEQALTEANAGGEDSAIAAAMLVLGDIEQKEGDLDRSSATLQRAASMFRDLGDDQATAEALRTFGMTAMFAERNDVAQASFSEALELFRATGDRRGEAWVLQNLAWLAYSSGRVDEADERLNDSAAMFSELGDSGGLGWALGLLAFVRFHQGAFDEAERLGEQMLVEARERGDRWAVGMMLVLLSNLRLWTGRAEAAIPPATEANRLFGSMTDMFGESQAIGCLTRALIATGRIEEGLGIAEDFLAVHDQPESLTAMFLVFAAAQAGVPDRSPLVVPGDLDEVPVDPGAVGFIDLLVARGLLALQRGDIDGAMPWLEGAAAASSGGFATSSLAVGYAASGRPVEAATVAAKVAEHPAATYSDRVMADLALGLARAADGDRDGAAAAIAAAFSRVDATEDRLLQAVARLARARTLELVDDSGAARADDAATERFAAMGASDEGWRTAFALVAASRSATAAS